MFCRFSPIFKHFPLISRYRGSQKTFQTVLSVRYLVWAVTCCNIPGYTVLSKLVKDHHHWHWHYPAEFGTQTPITISSFHTTPKSCTMGFLDSIADVEIDPSGKFKYILIEIEKPAGKKKTIVRGYTRAGYHDDIFQEICGKLEPLNFKCECLGGGRIEHNSEEKTLFVYGYSMGFGKANHEITVEKLKAHYPSYKVTFSNDGY